MKRFLIYVLPFLFVFSCGKGTLKEPYTKFIGTYEWVYTQTSDKNVWTSNDPIFYQTAAGYSYQLVLGEDKVQFKKNYELIGESKFRRIGSSESTENEMILKIKDSPIAFDDDKIKFKVINDTLVSIEFYPFPTPESLPYFDHEAYASVFRKY